MSNSLKIDTEIRRQVTNPVFRQDPHALRWKGLGSGGWQLTCCGVCWEGCSLEGLIFFPGGSLHPWLPVCHRWAAVPPPHSCAIPSCLRASTYGLKCELKESSLPSVVGNECCVSAIKTVTKTTTYPKGYLWVGPSCKSGSFFFKKLRA